jgi:hypothetical protein
LYRKAAMIGGVGMRKPVGPLLNYLWGNFTGAKERAEKVSGAILFALGASLYALRWWGVQSESIFAFLNSTAPDWIGGVSIAVGTFLLFIWIPFKRHQEQQTIVEQRNATIEVLSRKDAPQFILSAPPNDPRCNAYWGSRKLSCFRLLVSHNKPSDSTTGCYGRLLSISSGQETFPKENNEILPFADCSDPDSTSKTIHAGETIPLDVLCIGEDRLVATVCLLGKGGALNRPMTNRRKMIFPATQRQTFKITVGVYGNQMPPKYAQMRFFWSGEMTGSTLELLEQRDTPFSQ